MKNPRNVNISDIKILSEYDKKIYLLQLLSIRVMSLSKNIIGNFDYIQLHGSETKDRVAEIKKTGLKVIKAIKVKEEKILVYTENLIMPI